MPLDAKPASEAGLLRRVPLDDVDLPANQPADLVIALDEALRRLEGVNPRLSQLVDCRFFGGMSIEETAQALDLSPATIKRDWNVARAWLNRELQGQRS